MKIQMGPRSSSEWTKTIELKTDYNNATRTHTGGLRGHAVRVTIDEKDVIRFIQNLENRTHSYENYRSIAMLRDGQLRRIAAALREIEIVNVAAERKSHATND